MWLDSIRIAREFGTVEHLLPEGVESIYELPWQIADALTHACTILGWFENPNAAREDLPPQRIWHDLNALGKHFEAVRKRHKREAEHPSDVTFDDPVENAAVKEMLKD